MITMTHVRRTRPLRTLTLAAMLGLVAIAAAAQSGPQEFKDPKTGKVWTPDNVGTGKSTEPPTPADRAFDPTRQAATSGGTGVQAPSVRVLGSVPITAGPSVPIAVIDEAALRVIPAQRWQVTLHLNNNSADTINPVIDCAFTNHGQPVDNARASLPPVAGGQRVSFVVYGPAANVFVDRAECRLAS